MSAVPYATSSTVDLDLILAASRMIDAWAGQRDSLVLRRQKQVIPLYALPNGDSAGLLHLPCVLVPREDPPTVTLTDGRVRANTRVLAPAEYEIADDHRTVIVDGLADLPFAQVDAFAGHGRLDVIRTLPSGSTWTGATIAAETVLLDVTLPAPSPADIEAGRCYPDGWPGVGDVIEGDGGELIMIEAVTPGTSPGSVDKYRLRRGVGGSTATSFAETQMVRWRPPEDLAEATLTIARRLALRAQRGGLPIDDITGRETGLFTGLERVLARFRAPLGHGGDA